jgi:hypothetical protein
MNPRGSVDFPSAPRLLLEVLAFIAELLTISAQVRFVSAFMDATGSIAVLLVLAVVIEAWVLGAAGRFGDADRASLQRFVVVWTIVLPIVAVVAFEITTTEASILAVSGVCWVVGVSRPALFVFRRRCLRRSRARDEERWTRLSADGVDVPGRLGAPRRTRRATFLERAIASVICTLLLMMAGTAAAAIIEGVKTGEWRPVPHVKVVAPPPDLPRSSERPGKASGKPGGTSNNGLSSGNQTPEPQPSCPPIGEVPNVSALIVQRIERLFTLAGSGGATGCPDTVKIRSTSQGPMFWSVSWQADDPVPTAIAVIAPQEKRFVALGGAVPPIEKLIRAGQAIGAEREFARYYVGLGSVVVVLSDEGSTLITQETLAPGEPVVAAPPAVATAIRSSDKQHREWLWPTEPRSVGPEEVIYELKTSAAEPAIEDVHYDLRKRTAWRGSRQEPIPYTAHQQNLVISELQMWIPEPPLREIQLEKEIERDEG